MKLSGAIFKFIFCKAVKESNSPKKKSSIHDPFVINGFYWLFIIDLGYLFRFITNANVADISSSWFDHILSNKEDIFLTHYKTKAFSNCCYKHY